MSVHTGDKRTACKQDVCTNLVEISCTVQRMWGEEVVLFQLCVSEDDSAIELLDRIRGVSVQVREICWNYLNLEYMFRLSVMEGLASLRTNLVDLLGQPPWPRPAQDIPDVEIYTRDTLMMMCYSGQTISFNVVLDNSVRWWSNGIWEN